MSPPRAAVNRLTLREQVLDHLHDAIITGELRPGTTLIETELADAYQVSRGTVREALRYLQQAGLVTGDARGKLAVHRPDGQEMREIFRVRAALEGMAVREIIESPDHESIVAELRKHLPPAKAAGNFVSRLNLDLAFHEKLCFLSGNDTLRSTWKGLEDRMRIVLLSYPNEEPLPLMARDQHLPIIEAIEAGDVNTAAQKLFDHMEIAADYWAGLTSRDDGSNGSR